MLLTGTGEADLASPLTRLRQEVEAVNVAPEHGWQLRYSEGVATADPTSSRNIDDLLRDADERMYRKKREQA